MAKTCRLDAYRPLTWWLDDVEAQVVGFALWDRGNILSKKNSRRRQWLQQRLSSPIWLAAIISLPVFVIIGELLLLSSDHDFAHEVLEIAAPILVLLIAVLAALLFKALLYSNKRLDYLRKERNRARNYSARLRSQKAGIDAHAIVSITDANGRITYANDRFCEISQYSREELIGQDHRLLNSGYHPREFFSVIYEAISSGTPWSGDICNRAKDGSLYWVSTTIMPIRNSGGELVEIISIRTDITHVKRAAEELIKSNQILHTTFENFPGGISAYDKDLVLQLANPAFYELLDLPDDKLPVGCNFEDIIRYNAKRGEYGEGDIEELTAERVGLAKLFQPHHLRRTTPDGRVLEIKGWPLEDGGFVTSHRDITESEAMLSDLRQKNEEAQKSAIALEQARDKQVKTHQHLLDSINSMRNGFAIWGADECLVLANDAYKNINKPIIDLMVPGFRFEDMIRLGYEKGVWENKGLDIDEWLTRRMEERKTGLYTERELTTGDGRKIVVSDKRLDSGDIISTYVDVTAHREREAELKRTRDALKNIAYFDALTTLPNRAHCQQDLETLFADEDHDNKFAIIQIDLDNFKRVNDTMGHAAGDHLLKILGTRLSFFGSKVPAFKPYRWGGDEFIAIVEGDCPLTLTDICQELTDLIAIPVDYNKNKLWPTVSLGVARYPEDATDQENLMIYADLALYKTKELGRDGFQFFTADMKERIDTESRIEADIRAAIQADQFELYFQPQINTTNESITGVEALLRWNHPTRGLLPPGEFIDVVENHGLASTLGCIVFDKAMHAARKWSDQGLEFGRLAINLSPKHLRKNTLLEDFFEAVDKHQVNPDHLAVEFLESFLLDDPHSNVTHILEAMAARGVHVELDDFGTGYASLAHLSNLPVDGIKIDRSFVEDIAENEKQQAIVEVVMSMSKLMKLRVVCEGIESYQQLEAVSKISNCSVQGYLASRPLNFTAMTEWMAEKRNKGLLRRSMFRTASNQNMSMLQGSAVYE